MRFCILTPPRSGSTFFNDVLNSLKLAVTGLNNIEINIEDIQHAIETYKINDLTHHKINLEKIILTCLISNFSNNIIDNYKIKILMQL
jgi:hypothetical protein